MTNSKRQFNRNERQRQLNIQLSVLPTFIPLNEYEIYHINRTTSTVVLQDLIELARKTPRFTIDTEHDYFTHQAALIQIEFVQNKSIILLIETCHLPPESSVLFWLIRSLFKVIFQSSNLILSWGDIIDELSKFIQYGLFSLNVIDRINTFDIQHQFKKWYNKTFPHDCGLLCNEDNLSCTCSHRPVKDQNNKWSLQQAIAYTFNEFLDKRRTKSAWSRRLNPISIRPLLIVRAEEKKIQELIQYAVNDCLAVTKLTMLLEFYWTKEQLKQYNKNNQ